ncbi:hypothetical protein CLV56_0562 [Mumia flava]|uniref:CARDB domain-containing protein n=1 Tax=Mumia flava TaxID=1348852 RepID=A0A2M9BEI1_9ACTN|nr:hypothetical protein [Mumia flava]PJJ56356.1 hypothetical protein CLV56_0562 [Mumia flava]
MSRRLLWLLVPLVLALTAVPTAHAADTADGAEDGPGLGATASPGAGAPGDRIHIDGAGWPALTQIQAVVCGDLAVGGSAACDQTTAILAVANVDGEIDLDMVVGNPPKPCPCVVRVASYTGPALAVDIPFVVSGHPTGTPPSAALPIPSLRVTDVRLEGDGGIAGLFGASPERTLVVTVENVGNAPAVNPEVKIGVGRSDRTEPTVITERNVTIEPLQSVDIETTVALPFAAFGTYHVVGVVGQGEAGTSFSTTWKAYPWGLVALNVIGVVLLVWGIRRRMAARRARPTVDAARRAEIASRPYPLPDVVYVEAIGGFLVSPAAVGRTGLIKKLDGRLESEDLEALLRDPGLATGTTVLRGAGESSARDGAAVVDLAALDAWLVRGSARRRADVGMQVLDPLAPPLPTDPDAGGGPAEAPATTDAVVDIDAADGWLDRRQRKESS